MDIKDSKYSTQDTYSSTDEPHLLQGDALKQATHQLAQEIQTKIADSQYGVGTSFDHGVLGLVKELRLLDEALPWEEGVKRLRGMRGLQLRIVLPRLKLFLARRLQGRFVDFHQRCRRTRRGFRSARDIGILELAMSQGVEDCMQWRGLPLFKTVFDFSLYTMMLWNLKPRTIIELGSGSGASSIWLADLMQTFALDGSIYSVDLKKPQLKHEKVRFIQGDCRTIDGLFADEFLSSAPHPWLLIDDAHVNVEGVLRHFHRYLEQGDYVVVEDSHNQREAMSKFLTSYPGCYKIDTYYTDFFGRNATCAPDSIFVRA